MRNAETLSAARRAVLEWATQVEFSLVDRTKFVTAASELARNTWVHGQGGTMTMTELEADGRRGLRLVFEDSGAGIADIPRAMTDGFSTAGSMGKGLGGAQRLVNEFKLESTPGQGTIVTVLQWKRR
ncbi:anti-sigma regulatory factor [Caenimonas koreensis]|uniref:anti-sigma regulatory factor n=1 Tax=Caenimonas koreensis TaxID=367474 RepID=UPI002B26B31D|nr:anti-sigma regulatory factor [Caenimonas koreensis]